MRTLSFQLLCLLLISFASISSLYAQDAKPITAVPGIDMQRYLGRWYEIARLPNSFQTKCSCEVSAQYRLREDGDIDVINSCRKANGEWHQATGKAKRASDSEPNSKLKVRFAPAILSWIPYVWGDYWVIILAPDYSYAVVGEPSRKYLWILSRTPTLAPTIYSNISTKLSAMGYDMRLVQMTCQNGSSSH